MQPALRVDFGTLSCCMLRHLLFCVLCTCSPLPGWHLDHPCRSLGGLLFELSGVIFASDITSCHASLLPHDLLLCCFICFFFSLCALSLTECWDASPAFRPLEGLLFKLLYCSTGAVESRKAVQVFGIRLQLGMFPRTGTCASCYRCDLSNLGP